LKSKVLTALVIAVALCFSAFTVPVEAGVQLIFDLDLSPAKAAAFDGLVKDVHSVYGSYGFGYEVAVLKTDDLHAYKVYYLDNYGDVDIMNAFFGALPSQMPEGEFETLFVQQTLQAKCSEAAFFVERGDLAYAGTVAGDLKSGSNYVVQHIYTTNPGNAAAVEATLKDIVNLYESKGLTTGFSVISSSIGVGQPTYIISFIAESADAFNAQELDKNNTLGSKGQEDLVRLETSLLSLADMYEEKTGSWSPELAYKPSVK
jgi:hypothetical protein